MKHTVTPLVLGLMVMSGAAMAAPHAGMDMMGRMPMPMAKGDKPCPAMLDKNGKRIDMKDCMTRCHHMMPGMMGGMGGMDMRLKGDQGPSSQALNQANMSMHKGMDITYTGDADIDFLRGMIAHHQGAVDMAQAQLQYGKDAQVRRLAMEIIRAQNLEIKWMSGWLKQLEAKGVQKSAQQPAQGRFNDSEWMGKTWLNER